MLNVCRLKFLMVITFINFMLLGNTDSDTKLRENYLNSSYMLLGKSIIYDLLTLGHEINKINIIGNFNPQEIKNLADISKVFDLNSCTTSFIAKIIFYYKLNKYNNEEHLNKIVRLSRTVDLLSSLFEISSLKKDHIIFKDADKIAQCNKSRKIESNTTKLYQYIWLSLNKILPYISYIGVKGSGYLSNSASNIEKNALTGFEALKALSTISEIIRKQKVQQAIIGDYNKYANLK